MSRAEPLRGYAGGQIAHRLIGERGNHSVEKRDVHPLAFARAMARHHGEQDSLIRVETGDDVCDGGADLHRLPVGLACEIDDTRLALRDDVVARSSVVRARLAVTGNGSVDDARV